MIHCRGHVYTLYESWFDGIKEECFFCILCGFENKKSEFPKCFESIKKYGEIVDFDRKYLNVLYNSKEIEKLLNEIKDLKDNISEIKYRLIPELLEKIEEG